MAFPCEPSIHADRASAKPALGTGFSGAVEGELPFGRDTSQKKSRRIPGGFLVTKPAINI
jgi:hypothetical protein